MLYIIVQPYLGISLEIVDLLRDCHIKRRAHTARISCGGEQRSSMKLRESSGIYHYVRYCETGRYQNVQNKPGIALDSKTGWPRTSVVKEAAKRATRKWLEIILEIGIAADLVGCLEVPDIIIEIKWSELSVYIQLPKLSQPRVYQAIWE